MKTRLAALVILLRIAYLVGAGLFLVDILLSIFLSTVTTGDDSLTLTLPSNETLTAVMNWIALLAFSFAALGAVITVVVVTLRDETAAEEDEAERT